MRRNSRKGASEVRSLLAEVLRDLVRLLSRGWGSSVVERNDSACLTVWETAELRSRARSPVRVATRNPSSKKSVNVT